MTIFNFFVFNKKGTCIYYEEWNRSKKMKIEETKRNLYGLLFEMKRFVSKMTPSGEPPEYFSYTTNKYKLHCYETPSGKKFILLTDPKVGALKEPLRKIYCDIYVETVVRSPLCKMTDDSIQDFAPFATELNKFLQTLSCWRS